MARFGLVGLCLLGAIVLASLCEPSTAVPCGNAIGNCPVGQCCGFDGQCGLSDTSCGSGCNPEYGTCNGFFTRLSMPLTAQWLELVDVVMNPTQDSAYAFLNVMGPLNITSGSQILQYQPFQNMQNFKYGMVLEYNTTTLNYTRAAQYGAYDYNSSPGEDFKFVRAVWHNETTWFAYNKGPDYGISSNLTAIAFIWLPNRASVLLQNLGSTGVMQLDMNTLIPLGSSFTIPNLTSTDMAVNGSSVVLSGSFTMSPLVIPAITVNEPVGTRGECNDAEHQPNFKWCPGAEDGWNIKLTISGNQASILLPDFVFSQATGGVARTVKAISSSYDSAHTLYNCYASNNKYVVTGEANSPITYTADSYAFNRSHVTPSDNQEIFCTIISSENTFSFTNMGFNGITSNFLTTAIPTTTRELVSTVTSFDIASGQSETRLNITGVQGIGDEKGYVLQHGYDWAKVSHLIATENNEIIASGTFNGTLKGDSSNPINNIHGYSNVGSLFVFYYSRSESPAQIAPTNVFSLTPGSYVNFHSAKSVPMPAAYPKFLVTAIATADRIWTYNNTLVPATPRGKMSVYWGIYRPEAKTVPGPIFVFPPSYSPTPTAPTSAPTNTPSVPSAPTPVGAASSHAASPLLFFALFIISCLFW